MGEDPQPDPPRRDGPHDHASDHRGPLADASVRTARVNDAPAVGLVQAEVFRTAYGDVLAPEVLEALQPEAFAATWRESLAAPPPGVHRLLVACAGDQVAGIAAVGPSQDADAGALSAEVTLLGVHPLARRQGHGSRLLNACMDVLREAGAEEVAAWLRADDETTRAFLSGAGLTPDGAFRDRVVGDDGRTVREVRLVTLLGEQPDDDG